MVKINPLNSVDGNTLLIPLDEVYKYRCKECNRDVTEDEFNNKRNMCYQCWWKI